MPLAAKILDGGYYGDQKRRLSMDSFKKIIIVEKSMKPRRDEKGYVMMGVKEFLLDKDSLEA
jgi:hypothetical protein